MRARLIGRDKTAFTLLELILAMSLFSMIGLIVMNTFWGGVRLSEHSHQLNEIYRQARFGLSLMGQEVENMVDYDFSNSYEEKSAFIGDTDQLVFITATDDGLMAVRYRLIKPEESYIYKVTVGDTYTKNVAIDLSDTTTQKNVYLVREEKEFIQYLKNDFDGDVQQEVILSNVKQDGLELSYGYLEVKETQEDDMVWSAQWQIPGIPLAVRIDLEFQDPTSDEVIKLSKAVLIPHGGKVEQ